MSNKAEQEAVGISPYRLSQLVALIAKGREDLFYHWPEWLSRRADVLKIDRFECYICREKRRKYSRAVLVHHVKHLKTRPDLALSVWDPDTGERQLVSLCKACHEDEHPERRWRQPAELRAPVTAERWD